MAWKDLGVIFPVDKLNNWMNSHCFVPTPLILGDFIRVYAAFWDVAGYGRLGYVDIDADNPERVLRYSAKPCMSDSEYPAFDCDGITPKTAAWEGNKIRLYYTGWMREPYIDVRYAVFTGMAESDDGGATFIRHSSTPVLAPRNAGDEVRTGTILKDGLGWRYWGADFVGPTLIKGRRMPSYDFVTSFSEDGIRWPDKGDVIFPVNQDYFGYGRSAVWREQGLYHGLFSPRHRELGYHQMLYSNSQDGKNWRPLSQDGYAFHISDCREPQDMVAFPALVHQQNRKIMFYNGSNFGAEGLRAAIWEGVNAT